MTQRVRAASVATRTSRGQCDGGFVQQVWKPRPLVADQRLAPIYLAFPELLRLQVFVISLCFKYYLLLSVSCVTGLCADCITLLNNRGCCLAGALAVNSKAGRAPASGF